VVNDYSEDEWQEFEDNDIGLWDDGDLTEHLDEMQLFVEYALGMRNDLPGYNPENVIASYDHGESIVPEEDRVENPENPAEYNNANINHVRDSDLPDAEKLVWAVGLANNQLDLSSSSAGAHDIVLPVVQHFHDEVLDGESHLNTISTGSMEPETKRDFTHLMGTLTYEDENGELNLRYFEPTIGGGTPEFMPQVIRHPEESIYADSEANDAVTAYEYSKAVELLENNLIETTRPGRAAISGTLLADLWGYVDASGMGSESDHPETYEQNGVRSDTPLPPNFKEIYEELQGEDGYPVTVSPDFGQSVEENFDDYDREVEQKFENIGRGIQNFYEEYGGMAPLGLGGTVDEPEFYRLGIDKMKEAWETDYNQLSELVQ